MKRDDGSVRPHKRLTSRNAKPGEGAYWIQCKELKKNDSLRDLFGGVA